MMELDICQLVPDFLLSDKNGFALAKALEKGMEMLCQVIQAGLDTALDVEKMPPWRLDEMAWELGCLFDYNASTENKRAWIRDAVPLYASYGTVEAIYKYLGGYFDSLEVEENWQYGAEAYHFRVTVTGEWTDEKERWAKRAIEETKNVRSVLDDLSVGSGALLKIAGDTMWRRFQYQMTGPAQLTGIWPVIATIGKAANGSIKTSGEAMGQRFPYPLAGTVPQENTVSGLGGAAATAQSEGQGTVFSYPQTSGNTFCGENEI